MLPDWSFDTWMWIVGIFWLFLMIVGVWIGAIPLRVPETPSVPSSGPLVCPYCTHTIADDVRYLGQPVSCPKCFSQFNAPSQFGDPDVRGAIGRLLVSALVMLFGIFTVAWFMFW